MNYPTFQNGSFGLGVADFNHDGILDLLTIDFYSDTATLLIGNGDGSFQSPYSYAVGVRPNGVTVADLNGDGSPDLIAANNFSTSRSTGIVTVVLGNGDGSLRAPRAYFTGNTVISLAAADLNRDGILDLVMSNGTSSHSFGVYLGNGDGSFRFLANYSGGSRGAAMAIGDFNHDKLLDIAIVDSENNAVDILNGNGDGSFALPVSYAAGSLPEGITAGDLDKDGNLDLAVTNSSGGSTGYGSLSVLFGNGDGSFKAPVTGYEVTGADPPSIRAADLNGDGLLDLVAAANGFLGFPGANVLLNQGGGVFGPTVNYQSAAQATDVAVGDFNRDGKPDLVVTNQTGNVSVFLNQGGGTFGSAVNYAGGTENYSLALADFNGDGKLDIAMADVVGEVNLLLGNGNGTFQTATVYEPFFPTQLVAGDFNGDGAIDLAIGNDSNLVILLNNRGTKIPLSSSLNPSKVGQQVTFRATVTASLPGLPIPTGKVTFKDGPTKLATVALTGSTATFSTSTLTAGTHKITATYSGDTNFNPHSSPALIQKVTP